MFAVIECGGKQHTVSEGESLKVELLSAEEGSTIEFDKVLMISDGSVNLKLAILTLIMRKLLLN